MENALHMTSELHCKAVVVSAAFAANDSKYKYWHHIYQSIERAGKKHFKGECAVLFHNLFFEALYLNRDEITRESSLSWPISEDSNACPLAMLDFARCCTTVAHKLIKHENKMMSHKHKEFLVTGREKLTPGDMTQLMADSFNMDVEYNEVDVKQWKRMIEEMRIFTPLQIALIMEEFEMMEDGRLKKRTDEFKKLVGEEPIEFSEWVDENRDKFQGN